MHICTQALYHMKCINETNQSSPKGDWHCAECSLGGRGEAAGLRVPKTGRGPGNSAVWLAYGRLFAGKTHVPGDGEEEGVEREDEVEDGLVALSGWSAAAALGAVRRFKQRAGGVGPHPTSWLAVQVCGDVLVCGAR